ncbi:MAG: hypothetical protein AAJB65_00730 [Candidatus Hodgkinia cicadicola]
MFIMINLLTIHLNKLSEKVRDSVLSYQVLACPLYILMTYSIHHDLIPTGHGISGPFGRGGVLAWIVCVVSATFVLSLITSLWECVRALASRASASSYGLTLACTLFSINIMALMAYMLFISSRLKVISVGATVLSIWFGISTIMFDLHYNKHSFGLAILIATIMLHVIINRRRALIPRVAIGYFGSLAAKHFYYAFCGSHISVLADICHFSVMCALVCAGLPQLADARAHLSLSHALAAVKILRPAVSVLKHNVAIGVVLARHNRAYNGYIAAIRSKAAKLSSLIFSVASLLLFI